ncbi:MAG: hypothetical protein ISR48_08930 [Alphaproteobacteria bacterium]|nr:hypothetical protein [Alphaproteobacteria bacterium]
MNGDSLMGYLIVGLIVAACAFLVVRFVKRVMTGGAMSVGCEGCSENKDCDSTQKAPLEHL